MAGSVCHDMGCETRYVSDTTPPQNQDRSTIQQHSQRFFRFFNDLDTARHVGVNHVTPSTHRFNFKGRSPGIYLPSNRSADLGNWVHDRGHRRHVKKHVSRQSRKRQQVHYLRAVVLVTAPKLLRRNFAMDRHCSYRDTLSARLAIFEFAVTFIRLLAAYSNQRDSHVRQHRAEELG